LAQHRGQDPHHGPPQLGGHAQPRIGRELPVLPPVADVHGPVGWPRLALLRRLRRPHGPWRPQYLDYSGDLEFGRLPRRPPPTPRKRRPRRLPGVRPAPEGLAALDYQARLIQPSRSPDRLIRRIIPARYTMKTLLRCGFVAALALGLSLP